MNKFNLDSYILIEDEIVFKLNQDLLQKMEEHLFDISPDLIIDLRYYFIQQKQQNYPLVFVSYYQNESIIKTSISTNINNQVSRKYLASPQLIKQLNQAHHLLIQYILAKMKISGNLVFNTSLIAGIFAAVIVIVSLWLSWLKFISLNLFLLFLPLLMWWLLQQGIKRLLELFLPKFNRWIWHFLLLNKFIINKKITKFILQHLNR